MPVLAVEKWEQEHRKHVSEYLEKIDKLYEDAIKKLVRLGTSYNYDSKMGKRFSFSDNKAKEREVAKMIAEMNTKLSAIISAGVVNEWLFANEKNDSWMRLLFKAPQKEYMLPNLDALKAFQSRKIYGHTLSQRVWSYTKQFQEQMELALSVGITEGRSAANISRDIRSYLNEPDKLFRRVRDEFGNLVLSKSAKAYHPGQGVYRSSYQNAMRTARTEINMAYRQSDMTRWRQLYFIVGYEIKTSKTHAKWLEDEWIPKFREGEAPEEICDALEGKYPKDFNFVGWHPNCKCFAVPILANEDNKRDFWEKPLNEIKDVPKKFKQWIKANAGRIEGAKNRGTAPYWVQENPKYTDLSDHRTFRQKEIAKIVKAQDDRILHNEQFGREIKLTNKGIKEWLNQPHKSYITKNEMLLDIKQMMKEAAYLGSGLDKRNPDARIHLFETTIQKEKSWIIVKEFAGGFLSLYSISDGEGILNILKK